MILIADSGSTKTDWCLSENGRALQRVATQGINPFHQDVDTIRGVLTEELLPQMGEAEPNKIYFYGSGCREEMVGEMESILCTTFPHCQEIKACGDLIAAARAVCGREEGIACILGTGANSCLYDGQQVVMNTPPLGYILGDEGSGAVLGRLFLNAIFKKQLPSTVCQKFLEESQLTLSDIIHRVYTEPMANRFLASLSVYIHHLLDNDAVRSLVVNNFRQFFQRNVLQYGHHNLKVGAIGSIAYYYQDCLKDAAKAEGYEMGTIVRSPMEGLVRFHA